jgi:hypothetical protein
MAAASSGGDSGSTRTAPPLSRSSSAAGVAESIDASSGRPLASAVAIFDGRFAPALTLRCSTGCTSAEASRPG